MTEKLPQLQDAEISALRQLYPTLTDPQRVNMYLLHRPMCPQGVRKFDGELLGVVWLKELQHKLKQQ